MGAGAIPLPLFLGLAGLLAVALVSGPADLLKIGEEVLPRWNRNLDGVALHRLRLLGWLVRRLVLFLVGHGAEVSGWFR
jgi:hypothetical protein